MLRTTIPVNIGCSTFSQSLAAWNQAYHWSGAPSVSVNRKMLSISSKPYKFAIPQKRKEGEFPFSKTYNTKALGEAVTKGRIGLKLLAVGWFSQVS